MGCLVKKVNKKFVGFVLLQFFELVEEIFDVVVNVVDVFVILKICIGWDQENCNGVEIVRIVECYGIVLLVVYGCICVCMYKGEVEYVIIKDIKCLVFIFVVVNGDIILLEKVKQVLDYMGVDVIMIG